MSRLLNNGSISECLPVLTEEVISYTLLGTWEDVVFAPLSPAVDLNRIVVEFSFYRRAKECMTGAIFLEPVGDAGAYEALVENSDGDRRLHFYTYYDNLVLSVGGDAGDTVQFRIVEIDADVTVTTITQSSNAGEVLHTVDIIDSSKTVLSMRIEHDHGTPTSSYFPMISAGRDVCFSTSNLSGIRVVANESELAVTTNASSDSWTAYCHIRQFS